MASPTKVLVTGVYGLIPGAVYRQLQSKPEDYDVYGLARRRQQPRIRAGFAVWPATTPDSWWTLPERHSASLGPVWLNYDRELAWICAKILLPGDIFDSR